MKDRLYNYTMSALDLLAPELTLEEKETLVIKIVSENFPKCAAGYLKENKKSKDCGIIDFEKKVLSQKAYPIVGTTLEWTSSDYMNSLDNYRAV